MNICICITESLCYIPLTNTTWQINYTPIKFIYIFIYIIYVYITYVIYLICNLPWFIRLYWFQAYSIMGFPGGLDSKESTCNAGDPGLTPGSGRSPGEGNGYPLQYSCLENTMDREAWRATVHEVAKSWTQLSN